MSADYICVSSGGIAPRVRIPSGLGYQVPFAAHVKRLTGVVTRTAGHIVTPEQADAIVARGEADLVALARALLDNPHWVWHAANRLGVDLARPQVFAAS